MSGPTEADPPRGTTAYDTLADVAEKTWITIGLDPVNSEDAVRFDLLGVTCFLCPETALSVADCLIKYAEILMRRRAN